MKVLPSGVYRDAEYLAWIVEQRLLFGDGGGELNQSRDLKRNARKFAPAVRNCLKVVSRLVVNLIV